MTQTRRPVLIKLIPTLVFAVLGIVFVQRAYSNLVHHDYHNANFFDFWLAGRMISAGQNPYVTTDWLANRLFYGSTTDPNQVFLYPLPAAFLMAPLGLLTLPAAYFFWQLFTEGVLALVVWFLLRKWSPHRQLQLFFPLVMFLLYFGPVYVSLQIGSLAPLTLLAIVLSLAFLERPSPLLGGALLAFTMLKPPQGAPLVALAVLWFVAHRAWKPILGLILGGLALVAVGLIKDPSWVGEFLNAGRITFSRSLGAQSNVFGFAYLACRGTMSCTWVAGTSSTLFLLALAGWYLWRHRLNLTTWDAFNLIIPTAFVASPYLWSYDQFPYVLPITWIAGRLVDRAHTYLPTFVYLIALVLLSLASLVGLAYTGQELPSIVTSLLVLAPCWWLLRAPSPQTTVVESRA